MVLSEIGVAKFGGTSVKNIARIHHVAELVRRMPQSKRVVVVSAMGDTTDHLLALASKCAGEPDRRELDVLLSTGEQISIALLAMTLRSFGLRAGSFTGPQIGVRTDGCHTSAQILNIDAEALRSALARYDVVVVAGFQGISTAGDITTLGRGGSDTSAVALAVACAASSCDIFTDVNGIYSADPNVVATARLLPHLSYQEALSMALNGAQVIHPRAVELAARYGIALRIRNTFQPEAAGTLVDAGPKKAPKSFIPSLGAIIRESAAIACTA